MVRLYAAADLLPPVVARVASLQDYLASKEVVNRTAPELGRTGALECLASICLTNGTRLGPTISRTVASAIKLIGRCAAASASAKFEGCHPGDGLRLRQPVPNR